VRQQINLYQPIFSETRTSLSFALAAVLLAVVIVGLTVHSVLENSKVAALTAEVEALRLKQGEQDALLTATSEQQAGREKPVAVEARIEALDRAIVERKAALKFLQSGAAGQSNGFADRMEALARRHVEGLWIDRLLLSGTNGSMVLMGGTVDADKVPEYLQSLARDKVLSGTRFDDFIIERPKPVAAKGETEQPQPPPQNSSIRFRAGTKSLSAPVATEQAAT
jgi:hypothetical protein